MSEDVVNHYKNYCIIVKTQLTKFMEELLEVTKKKHEYLTKGYPTTKNGQLSKSIHLPKKLKSLNINSFITPLTFV